MADFTSNVTQGCASLYVSFQDRSTGSPFQWYWEVSNGALASAQNPTIRFDQPGTYTVKLVVRNKDGVAQVEKQNYITVFPSPTANFRVDIRTGCAPSTMQFTDLSQPTSDIVDWSWNFGDGNTSNQQNPSHSYPGEGYYSVGLTVTSTNGCKSTMNIDRLIRIVSGVDADFSFQPSSNCQAPYSMNFTDESSGPGNISYLWDFGNGQTSTDQNPSTVFNSKGTYKVKLTATSDFGCGGSVEKDVVIGETITDFSVPENLCPGNAVTFTNASTSTPVSSTWYFSDGTTVGGVNAVKTFTAPGTYDVKLINRYADCTDSVSKTITVASNPPVDFTFNNFSSCGSPFKVEFKDASPNSVSWFWEFGDGSTSNEKDPVHFYNATGNYTVKLTMTTSGGCTNSVTKDAAINAQPLKITLNTPAGGCIPYTYNASATVEATEPVSSWQWNFGDGNTGSGANPSHTYNTVGSYDISLTVTTINGCTQSITVPRGVQTGTPPSVDFNFDLNNVCASDAIQFTGITNATGPDSVKYHWEFDDGSTDSLLSPKHIFLDTGQMNVKFIVSNNRCKDSVTKIVTVFPPVANFGYTVNCSNNVVTFRDSSKVNPALAPLTYQWNFGDPAGTTATGPNPPPVTYPGPGTYNVSLTVVNGACDYTRTKQIIITDEPIDFTANPNTVCPGQPFTLTAVGSDETLIKHYAWQVGTRTSPDTTRSITYWVPALGSYDVTLTITDINGCKKTGTKPNFLTTYGPSPSFTAAGGSCVGKDVTFTDQTISTYAIASWEWNFGDGTVKTFTAPPFTHSYTAAGSYRPSLKVTDINGCSGSVLAPQPILITQPSAGFRADTFYCPQAPLQFIDTSAGLQLQYLWSFGDGGTSSLQNPTHSYPNGDNRYTVSLKVTDQYGCEDEVTMNDYISIRSPKAAFAIKDTTTLCPPLKTSFTFQGTDYKTLLWDFGDGDRSISQSPQHFYNDYGTFIPKLYLTGPGGCMDSAEARVSVYNPGNATVNYGPQTTACNSITVDFNITVPPGYKFKLNFGDNTFDSSGRTSGISHTYSQLGMYKPSIILFDTLSGCILTRAGGAWIHVLGANPLYDVSQREFCDNAQIFFRDYTTKNDPIVSTFWDFADGFTSTDQNPSHTFTQPGLYPVSLTVTTQNNCTKTFTDTIFAYRTPTVSINAPDTLCEKSISPINGVLAYPDTLITWNWNFGNGQTSTIQNNNYTYPLAGDYTMQVIAANKIGCSDTAFKTVNVAPLPTAKPSINPIRIVVGTTTNLPMQYTGDIISYNWSPVNNLSCTDCPYPLAKPQFSTDYKVEVTDIRGCMNTGEISVHVVCTDENFFVPNTFSPNGDGRNEVFYPRGTGLYLIKSFQVFNRWGEVVFLNRNFSPNNPSAGWDGKHKGKPASPDVYIYMLEIQCDNNTIIPVKGNVTLLR